MCTLVQYERTNETNKKKLNDSGLLAETAIKGIEERKGIEITCLDFKKIPNASCDYFVICEGNSSTHVKALAGSVEEYIKKELGTRPWHTEGLQNSEWILMDYINVVVHIFQPHIRQHYALEDMWADAEVKSFKPLPVAAKNKKTAPKSKVTAKKKKTTIKKTVKKKVKKKK